MGERARAVGLSSAASLFLITLAANTLLRSDQETQQGSFRGHPYPLFLLSAKPIQDDVGLSEAQRAQIAELGKSYVRATREYFADMARFNPTRERPLSESDRRSLAAIHQSLNGISCDYEDRVGRILNGRQAARLKQLGLYMRGVWIFLDPEIRSSLQIADAQWHLMQKHIKEGERACAEIGRNIAEARRSPEALQNRLREIQQETREKVLGLLAPEQTTKLREMLGTKPPFEPEDVRLRLTDR